MKKVVLILGGPLVAGVPWNDFHRSPQLDQRRVCLRADVLPLASPGSPQTRSWPKEIELRCLIGLLHCEFRIRPSE